MTNRFVAEVDTTDANKWPSLLCQFDDASIYQSAAYGSVHWGASQLSRLVLKDDSKVVAITQLRIVQLPILRKGIAYIRSGPLCRLRGQPLDPEVLREVSSAIQKEYAVRRGLLLRIIPPVYADDSFAEVWESTWSCLGLTKTTDQPPHCTMRIDLSPSLEDLRKNLHQRWRNYLRSAEKSEFTVREADNIEFYDRFLDAYRQMMTRKQFQTTVDVDEFRQIQAELPEGSRMQVFLCEKGGKLYNALIVAAAGDTGIYLLAATTDEGLSGKGAHLLQWRAMEWLKSHNCRWYELGGINPEKNPGVFQFKSGLGGSTVNQLGVFEFSADWASAAFVRAAERAQTLFRGLGLPLSGRKHLQSVQ
jgi:hypothetical protein